MHGAWRARVALLLTALWWGSLGAIGFVAVPLLFANLPSAGMAGRVAARLFSAQTWVGIACALPLLAIVGRNTAFASVDANRNASLLIVIALWLAVVGEWAIAPRILARENLALWHALGSAAYLAQWVCVGWVLLRWPLNASGLQPAEPGSGPDAQVNRPDAS